MASLEWELILPSPALVAQLVEHRFCKAVVASSSLVGGFRRCGGIGRRAGFRFQCLYDVEVQVLLPTFQLTNWIMSLISQKDREIVIAALEAYSADAATLEYYLGTPKYSSSEIYALLNWIKLEHFKHSGD